MRDWRARRAVPAALGILGVLFLTAMAAGGGAVLGAVRGMIDSAPALDADSIAPKGYATMIYDRSGGLTDTLVMEGSNRDPAVYGELPQDLIDAFVTIEDARFWEHGGIDLKAIARAAAGVLTGNPRGGGSTITQQLIKNNVFEGGREASFGARLERKVKEQYLAVRLEQAMDKQTILLNYLNTVNLGNNTLGVKTAARRYFGKEVSELTLSECAVLAGITQNPARLNPISGRKANEEKRRVILKYMEEQGYISEAQREDALSDPVYDRIQTVDMAYRRESRVFGYYTDQVVEEAGRILTEELSYTENQAYNLLYGGGLEIYTAQDPELQAVVDGEIGNPENYPAARFSLDYRLSVRHEDGRVSHYSQEDIKKWNREEQGAFAGGLYGSRQEAEDDAARFKSWRLADGDQVMGETLNVTLQPQVSFVLMETDTGRVRALSGGRGEKSASLTLNRAAGTLRQPGSTFKILTAFAPALDVGQRTLADVYYDGPYRAGAKAFSNWYSGYTGFAGIRDGIVYSMNIVAVRCLMETVTPELGAVYGKSFGITSLTDQDVTPALVLGGISRGVTNLEMTAAFAAIGNGGLYEEPVFIERILDRDGRVMYEAPRRERRVIRETTAFLLTDAMRESMTGSRRFSVKSISATGARSAFPGMSQAGKSGTTTGNRDLWFVGYTPYYTAGVWAGNDENQPVTGGTSFHKDIWRRIMEQTHAGLEDPGFSVPSGITGAYVCRKSGKRPIPGVCTADPRGDAVYREYFSLGTEPEEFCDRHVQASVCAVTQMAAAAGCPETELRTFMAVPEGEGDSEDMEFTVPAPCTLHGERNEAEPEKEGQEGENLERKDLEREDLETEDLEREGLEKAPETETQRPKKEETSRDWMSEEMPSETQSGFRRHFQLPWARQRTPEASGDSEMSGESRRVEGSEPYKGSGRAESSGPQEGSARAESSEPLYDGSAQDGDSETFKEEPDRADVTLDARLPEQGKTE